jgi:regulator of RNase E activity RraA
MKLAPATREKLLAVGTTRITAALAKHGLRQQTLSGLRPLSAYQDVLVGRATKSIDALAPGDVLVAEGGATSVPVALLVRRRASGVLSDSPLRNAAEVARAGLPAYHRPPGATKPLSIEAHDIVLGDRNGVVAIPIRLVEQTAEEAVEALAYEEFVAEQVSSGGGVYGLHIPSGEHARRAFAAWRRIKGR